MNEDELYDIDRFQRRREEELRQKAGLFEEKVDKGLSDEEVLALESEEEELYPEEPGENERTENWGRRSNNYYGGEDDVGEDEEAQIQEEEEAIRLQQAHLEHMDEDDFVDKDDLESWKTNDTTDVDVQQINTKSFACMDGIERHRFIEEGYPEIKQLVNELNKCLRSASRFEGQSDHIAELQKAALSSYVGTIYAYFAIFADKALHGVVDIKGHSVMEGIKKARQLWQIAKGISGITAKSSFSEADEERLSLEHLRDSAEKSTDEQDESESCSHVDGTDESEKETDLESDSADEFDVKLPVLSQPEVEFKSIGNDFAEIGDSVEQRLRDKGKKMLRFYTSRITKKAAVRSEDITGDLDVPHRERAYVRRQRMVREQKERLQDQSANVAISAENDDIKQSEHAPKHSKAYLDLVDRKNREKTVRRTALQTDAIAAAKAGHLNEFLGEHPEAERRAITLDVLKNKGLQRKQKKTNSNPRLKRRARYERAEKKLKSIRHVYKEGHSKPYGGEYTGIRKNVVHSVKFK